MGRKSRKSEPDRLHRLSLAELASHDDTCTDAMIDKAYYKAQIRKNKAKYTPLRGVREEDVPHILLHKVIVGKDPVAAEKALLQLPGIQRYLKGLRPKAIKENFVAHLRKYIYMYMTDCPWEVSTTNRYTITTFEAAVTARHRIKQHQTIQYLVGTLVPLSAEESAELDTTNRNFSIVLTGKKKNSSIFLGPARFANHDCEANARLIPKGGDSMEVMAIKNIEPGDEITVSYGDDYFGPANMDCLCHTCEVLARNGWSSTRTAPLVDYTSEPVVPKKSVIDYESWRRPRTSNGKFARSMSQSSKPTIKTSPSKLQNSWTPPSTSDDEDGDTITVAVHVPSAHQEQQPVLTPPSSETIPEVAASHTEISPQQSEELVEHDKRSSSKRKRSSRSPSVRKKLRLEDALQKPTRAIIESDFALPSPMSPSTESSEIRSQAPLETVTVKLEAVESTKIESDVPYMIHQPASEQPESLPSSFETNDVEQQSGPDMEANSLTTITTTKLSTTEAHAVRPESAGSSTPVPSIEPAITSTTTTISTNTTINVQPLSAYHRTPGDWFLTRKLLAQPHDRWVQCHNERCLGYFLQHNGYQTRRECPRCERHSMLYGFCWPKTDPDRRKILERGATNKERHDAEKYSQYRRHGKQGKGTWYEGCGDGEERTMDHRSVHRFVLPEDEKVVTRKGLLKQAELARLRGENFEGQFGREGNRRRTDSEALDGTAAFRTEGSVTPDAEGRRRSNRIVQVRVYANV